MDVGAERLVVPRDGRDDFARLRRRRGTVEIDERRAVVAALEQRKPFGPHQRLTSRYLPEASGAMARTRSPRIGRCSSAPTAVAARAAARAIERIDDEQGVAGELPLLERRLRAERCMDRVVEHQRRDRLAANLRAVALPALDALEQRAVALETARAIARLGEAHDVADVVAQKRHPGAAERRHQHSRQPPAARQGHEIDVAVPLVGVQPAVLAFHEEHAGFGGAVQLEQRRIEGAADVAPHRTRRRLVGQRDELRRRQAHAPLERGASDDREIGRVGFDTARRKVAPFAQHPLALAIGPMRRIGAFVEKQDAVDVALGRRLAAEMAGPGAAGRRRQHGFAILGAPHRLRDPRVEPHRFAFLRVPPRPFPDDL